MLGGYTHAVGVTNCLIDALYLSLGGFDVQSTHVLPVLLQQGNKEIYCNVDVLNLQNTVRLCCTQEGERKGEKMWKKLKFQSIALNWITQKCHSYHTIIETSCKRGWCKKKIEKRRKSNTYQLLRGLGDVSDGSSQAKNLLQLELNSWAQLMDLVHQTLTVGDEGRELTGSVQTGGKTGNLSDNGLGGKESVVLLGCRYVWVPSPLMLCGVCRDYWVLLCILCWGVNIPSFLMSFLFLFNFFKASTSMESIPALVASSMCCTSPSMQTLNLTLVMLGSFT